MSEFTWGPEVAEETRPDQQSGANPAEEGTLAVSADEFSALEERVLRAVNVVKRERLARAAAEERGTLAEVRVLELTELSDKLQSERDGLESDKANLQAEKENLQKEIETLRSERDSVRQRVERLLSQLEELEA